MLDIMKKTYPTNWNIDMWYSDSTLNCIIQKTILFSPIYHNIKISVIHDIYSVKMMLDHVINV